MTKRHFEAIARAIASQRTAVQVREQTRAQLAIAISSELGKFNDHFDAGRFLKACDLTDQKGEQHDPGTNATN